MTHAELVKIAASARTMMEIAGADTSAIAQLCKGLGTALVEILEVVEEEEEEATEAAANHVKRVVRQYQCDLQVATAALLETRKIEARLRVVEAQLGTVMAPLASQSHIDHKLH